MSGRDSDRSVVTSIASISSRESVSELSEEGCHLSKLFTTANIATSGLKNILYSMDLVVEYGILVESVNVLKLFKNLIVWANN